MEGESPTLRWTVLRNKITNDMDVNYPDIKIDFNLMYDQPIRNLQSLMWREKGRKSLSLQIVVIPSKSIRIHLGVNASTKCNVSLKFF